jgi:RND family efflux transporter MFP subunit
MNQLLSDGKPAPTVSEASPHSTPPMEQSGGRWGRRMLIVVVLLALGLGGGFAATMVSKLRHEQRLEAAARQTANTPPTVTIVTARRAPSQSDQNLPGNALPFREAALYARTTGYIKYWTHDLGEHVTEGEVLAEISAPDVDDQLAQARANLTLSRANLKVSEANLTLAKITLARDMASGNAVSLETIDQDKAQLKTTEAQVGSANANIEVNTATVKQFEDLQAFQRIVAPFSGVITVRNIDPGALVTADNPSETRELFHIMQTDPLRVFVNVPQVYATTIALGQEAIVYRQEEPGKVFKGKVTRTANALDPNTRTLLTEVDVANPKDALRPGMYLRVNFVAVRDTPPVIIPSAALITRNGGLRVAIMDQNETVRYRDVRLGRDYGAEVEVIEGLHGGENIIVHPGDTLPEGQKVEAREAKQ